MAGAITRVTVNVTRHETCVYELEGVLTQNQALEAIATGANEPVSSRIHSEDLDIVEIRRRVLPCNTTTEGPS